MTDPAVSPGPVVRTLGRVDYVPTEAAMRDFTDRRGPDTVDEIWLCEHPPVYTLGIAGKAEHVLNPHGIPVVRTGRGGQVTYHGPGQVVVYPLVDLGRLGIHVKEYVYRLEHAALKTLEGLGVTGHRVAGAPGIYVRLDDPWGHAMLDRRPVHEREPANPEIRFAGLGKIAALGVKISRRRAYHGLAFNVAMDLSPFDGINPCGYAGLKAVDLATLGVQASWDAVATRLARLLAAHLAP